MVSQYQTCECDAFTRNRELKEGIHCYGAVSLEPGKFKKAVCVGGNLLLWELRYMLCLHSSVNNKEV